MHETDMKFNVSIYKQSFIGSRPCRFIYLLSVAAFTLQWPSWVVAAKTEWHAQAESIYYLALYRKTLPAPALVGHS